jgi:hypothetical protein
VCTGSREARGGCVQRFAKSGYVRGYIGMLMNKRPLRIYPESTFSSQLLRRRAHTSLRETADAYPSRKHLQSYASSESHLHRVGYDRRDVGARLRRSKQK